MAHDAQYWIARLGLQPHPEGGYFRQTFRSADDIQTAGLPLRYGSSRSCSTAIYFLLEAGQISALHRIESDEVWHFYTGASLTLHVIDHHGEATTHRLGADVEQGDAFQVVIPARHWFGATLNESPSRDTSAPPSFTLVGCTVAPGFCYNDFELGDRATLIARYPQHQALIERLTHLPD
jgi:uncharacterized protein